MLAQNDGAAVDNGDGTYNCSYTPPEGADKVEGGKRQLEMLLNGNHIVRSPFAVEMRPSNITNWCVLFDCDWRGQLRWEWRPRLKIVLATVPLLTVLDFW